MVTINVGLAYRDDTVSEWTEMAQSLEQRKLNCNFTTSKVWKCHIHSPSLAACCKTIITTVLPAFTTIIPFQRYQGCIHHPEKTTFMSGWFSDVI